MPQTAGFNTKHIALNKRKTWVAACGQLSLHADGRSVATSAKSAGGRVVLEDFGCERGTIGSRVYENISLMFGGLYKHFAVSHGIGIIGRCHVRTPNIYSWHRTSSSMEPSWMAATRSKFPAPCGTRHHLPAPPNPPRWEEPPMAGGAGSLRASATGGSRPEPGCGRCGANLRLTSCRNGPCTRACYMTFYHIFEKVWEHSRIELTILVVITCGVSNHGWSCPEVAIISLGR